MATLISLLRLSIKLQPSKYKQARELLDQGKSVKEIEKSLLNRK